MNAINNTALLNVDQPAVNTVGFVPAVSFVYDPVGKTITCTDASTFPATDSFKSINVKIHDTEGGTVVGHIVAADGTTGALDVSAMVLTDDLAITATVVSTLGCLGDGTARKINSGYVAGSLGKWTSRTFTTAVG